MIIPIQNINKKQFRTNWHQQRENPNYSSLWLLSQMCLCSSESNSRQSSQKIIPLNYLVSFIVLYQGLARTQSPTQINCAPELPTFGVIAGVSPTEVQWKSLFLGEPPSWSRFLLCQVSMLRNGQAGLLNAYIYTIIRDMSDLTNFHMSHISACARVAAPLFYYEYIIYWTEFNKHIRL